MKCSNNVWPKCYGILACFDVPQVRSICADNLFSFFIFRLSFLLFRPAVGHTRIVSVTPRVCEALNNRKLITEALFKAQANTFSEEIHALESAFVCSHALKLFCLRKNMYRRPVVWEIENILKAVRRVRSRMLLKKALTLFEFEIYIHSGILLRFIFKNSNLITAASNRSYWRLVNPVQNAYL